MARDPFGSHAVVLDDAERSAIQRWVDENARRLGLPGWRIVVSAHGSEKNAYASSFIADSSDHAFIALAADWHDATPDELRHSLTHELLHPHFQRVTRLAEKLIENELGQRTEAVIEQAVQEVEEQTIDRLAFAIAALLPLVEVSANSAAVSDAVTS